MLQNRQGKPADDNFGHLQVGTDTSETVVGHAAYAAKHVVNDL
jgi:hypothetical protein